MSFLGSIGGAIKKGVVGVGHVAGKVLSNPIVDAGIGAFLGPGAAAAAGGLGHLIAPGGNLGSAVGGAVQGGLAGGTGGAIRKLGTGILQNGVGSVLGGGLHPTGTFSGGPMMDANGIDGQGYGNIIDYDEGGNPIYGGSSGGGIDWGGMARKLGSGLLGGGQGGGGMGGLGGLATLGLGGYQAINAANASKRAGQMSDKALALADQRYADAAPLRQAGQARLLNTARPDLTSVYQDTTNPFAARKLNAGASGPSGLLAQLAGGR